MSTPEEMTRRAAALRKSIAAPESSPKSSPLQGMAVRICAELVAAVGVGGTIGWFVDAALETSPVFLLVCTLCGIGAGFLTVKRVNDAYAREMEKSEHTHQETLDKTD
jgi:F0F1-type ATP synthase assembly protein I